MITQDAIDYAEGVFDCKVGYPGRWATSRGRDKEYVTIDCMMAIPEIYLADIADPITEHRLTCQMINALRVIHERMRTRVRLLWRFADKIRYEPMAWSGVSDDESLRDIHITRMRSRLWIEGCNEYGYSLNKHWKPHNCRLVVSNTQATPLLTLNPS